MLTNFQPFNFLTAAILVSLLNTACNSRRSQAEEEAETTAETEHLVSETPSNQPFKLHPNSANDIKRLRLRGPIKKLYQKDYVEWLGEKKPSTMGSPSIYYFDRNGCATSYWRVYGPDSVPTKTETFRHIYSGNFLVKTYRVRRTCSNYRYSYNDQGLLDTSFMYICDEGKRPGLVHFDVHHYNNAGILISRSSFGDGDSTYLTERTYIFENGKRVKEIWSGHNPSNRDMDEYGHWTTYSRTRDDGTLDSTHYKFKYDSMGNWIEKVSYNMNDTTPSSWKYREIEYWTD